MALRDGCYARIWSAKPNGKIYNCNISVSRKDKETNQYKTEFSGYVNFSGQAAQKVAALGLPENYDKNNPAGRNIKIKGSPDISTYYNKESYEKLLAAAGNNEMLTKFIRSRANEKYITIWDFELPDDNSSGSAPAEKKSAKKSAPAESTDVDEDELPF